jgi:uncharacterized membrane protein YhdT
MNTGRLYYRNSLVSIITPCGITVLIVVLITLCALLPIIIMNGVCNTPIIKEIYDRLFYNLPASSVVCYFNEITQGSEENEELNEFASIILLIGTIIFIGLIIIMVMTIYKSITMYISIIYHFIKKRSERTRYVSACITDKAYRDILIWKENKQHSYVLVSVCFTIYFLANLLTSNNNIKLVGESILYVFPIIYFIAYDIYKTIMEYRKYKKMPEDNFI